MKQFLIIFAFFGLVACGSESDDGSDLLGIWESPAGENKSYLMVTRDGVSIYSEGDYFNCFHVFEGSLDYLDGDTFSFTILEQKSTLKYRIENNLLIVDSDDSSLTRIAQLPEELDLCSAPALAGSIDIELEFASLPTDSQLEGYQSVGIDVLFDVDSDGEWSNGDIRVEVYRNKADVSVLSMYDLRAASYYRYEVQNEDEAYQSSDTRLSRFDYMVEGTSIILNVPRSGHKAFEAVTGEMPIRIEAEVASCSDSIPDTEGYLQGGTVVDYSDTRDDVVYFDGGACPSEKPELDLISATVNVSTF